MRDINAADQQLQSALMAEGPFVSLYLNTQVESQNAPREIELRWRGMREAATNQNASAAALEAIDELVVDAHKRGKGLVAFASPQGVVYRRHLDARPMDDLIQVDALPHLMPLIEWRQENPSHGSVLASQGGAEIYVGITEAPDERVTVEGSAGDHVERTASGGSERNLQHRAETLVEDNAAEVAAELTTIVNNHGLEVILLAGEEHSLGYLRKVLPESLRDNIVDLGERAPRGASFDQLQDELDAALAAYSAQTTEQLLGTWRQQRARGEDATETAGRTVEALRKAQVDTLLIGRETHASAVGSSPSSGNRRAWFSTQEPAQVALEPATLSDLGLEGIGEAPLADVLVRCAYSTGAKVRVIPEASGEDTPAEGIGAILRYS